ncbi:GNAT family N-acetyltransferase [Streptomyces kaniharaensis]|uniref:GNAT family N-acetyltransferase n=1 Tax=Streptomyces kaniharaensis TaxID=212423 RepID=A0A6N7KXG6_9ACTN|nr:GNAT family N-acetyltransferase [Streptomyces kaniharaensis]
MTASHTHPRRLWNPSFRRSDRRCAVPDGQAARQPALTGGPFRVGRAHPAPLRPQAPPEPREPLPDVAVRMSLPDGTALTVRPTGPGDKAEARAMHQRCSPASLRSRYHGPVRDADRYLDHLLNGRHGRSLAVTAADGRIVALGHLMWDDGKAELAVLVEDAWQRRGLGLMLLRRLSAMAREAGIGTVYAVTHASNTGLITTMRRLSAPLEFHAEDGTLVITAVLATAVPAAPQPGR